MARTREALVYELRVPLKKTSENPFAVEPISGHRIGIEFETGELNSEQNKGGMQAGGGNDRWREWVKEILQKEAGIGGGRRPHGGGRSRRSFR